MENEFKGTKWPWVADLRGGCAAIYPASCIDDTPGCHRDDSRNIAYSNKGAKFNGMRWEIDSSVEHDFNLMAAAPELLEALQKMLSKAYKQNWNEQYPEELLLAEESIKKALGKKQ